MLLEEMLRDERVDHAKSILLSLLDLHGLKDDQMLEEVDKINNTQLLDELIILVAKSTSTEEFLTAYKQLMS